MDAPLLMRILASSVSLAGRASTIIRNVLASKSLEIVDKGVDDLQSKADRDAQRCIVGSLSRSFPGLNIIGEEGKLEDNNLATSDDLDSTVLSRSCPPAYSAIPLSDMVVWVDPLDGTKEFTEGLVDYVTILIGIAVKGRPIAGVIAQPFYRSNFTQTGEKPSSPSQSVTRIIWALDGLGLFGVTPTLPPGRIPYPIDPAVKKGEVPNIAVVSRSHPTANLSAAVDACAATEVVRAGGCGYKVIMLLEGRAHVYLFPSQGAKRWDTCAPEAVLTAAGGRLSDMFGRPYDYSASVDPMNRFGVMATPVANWLPVFVQRIPPSVCSSML